MVVVVLRVLALLAGLALALPPAAGAVYAEVVSYAHGYLAPSQGFASYTDDATFANWCSAIYGAELDKPAGYFATAALIAPDGSWRASYRSTVSAVSVTVTPLTLAGARAYRKKAYGKNSDPSWTSLNPGCPMPVR